MRRAAVQSDRGFALLPAALALALVALTVMALVTDSALDAASIEDENDHDRAWYLAQAGVAHARATLAGTTSCTGYTGVQETDFGPGSYRVDISPVTGAPVTITSVGTLADGSMNVAVVPGVEPLRAPQTYVLQPPPGQMKDTHLRGGANKDNNFGVSTLMEVEHGGAERFPLLQFDLSSLGSGASVSDATLSLYLDGGGTLTNGRFDVHRITRSWDEGTRDGDPPGFIAGATFQKYNGFWDWQTAGGDYDPTVYASEEEDGTTPRWIDFDVTDLVNGWAQGSYTNYGLMIRGDPGVDKVTIRSSDHADASTRPRLTVTASCPCSSSCGAPNKRILMIGRNAFGWTAQETAKRDLLQQYGFQVTILPDSSWSWSFDSAIADNDAIYVPEEVNTDTVVGNLLDADIGIVLEKADYADDFGLADDLDWTAGNDIAVTDTAHYITRSLVVGPLATVVSNQQLAGLTGTLAADLRPLADNGSGAALATLETDKDMVGGGKTAGRRALVPWGDAGFDIDNLTSNGQAVLVRALEWAGGEDIDLTMPVEPIALSTESNATLGGLIFEDVDIAHYLPLPDTASVLLDGSAVGLASEIDALHLLANGHLLLALRVDAVLGGFAVTAGDLIDYDPDTASAKLFLNAAEHFGPGVGVTGVHAYDDGTLAVALNASALVGGVAVEPNDVLRYDPLARSATLLLDGGAAGLGANVTALQVLPDGRLVLGVDGTATLGGLTFGTDQLADYDIVLDTATRRFDGTSRFADPGERILSVHTGAPSGVIPDLLLPVAHWRFDETTGLIAVDSAGGHDGTVSGAQWSAGQVQGALDFDGSNDWVDVAHSNELSLSERMTFMAWINPERVDLGYQAIVIKSGVSASSNYWFGLFDDEPTLGFYQGIFWREVFTTSAVNAGAWQHLAITWDTATNEVQFFIDGSLVDTAALIPDPVTGGGGLNIGRSVAADWWNGLLDDVRIYPDIVAAGTIAAIAAESSPGGGGGGGGGGEPCSGNVRDEFNGLDYAGSDGSLAWLAGWEEIGEATNPAANDIRVQSGGGANHVRLKDDERGIVRGADLSAYASATLSYTFLRDNTVEEASHYVAVEASATGSDPWTEIGRVAGPSSDSSPQPASHDLTAWLSPTTTVRFITSPSMPNDVRIYIDDVDIAASGCAGP